MPVLDSAPDDLTRVLPTPEHVERLRKAVASILEGDAMDPFDEYWATTGPWPDNIMTTAFRELAEKAFRAGAASSGALLAERETELVQALDATTAATNKAADYLRRAKAAEAALAGVRLKKCPACPAPENTVCPECGKPGLTPEPEYGGDTFMNEISKLHGHPGKDCWLGCTERKDPPRDVAPRCSTCDDKGGYCVECWEPAGER